MIGLGAALILITFWIAAGEHRSYRTYLVYMNEAVSGLSINAPVKFNGVDVGYVKQIDLNPLNPQQVQLLLKVDENVPINESTTATLLMQGITGVTYVGLKANAVEAPPLKRAPGNKYPIIKSTPSLLLELDTALREATHGIKNVSQMLSRLLSKENQEALSKSLQNIEKFSSILSEDSQTIDQSIKNANKLLENAAKASESFDSTMNSVNQTAQKLSRAGDEASSVMNSVSQQALPTTLESLQRLSELLNNLESLSEQLKNNPSILIRGKQPALPGPGE